VPFNAGPSSSLVPNSNSRKVGAGLSCSATWCASDPRPALDVREEGVAWRGQLVAGGVEHVLHPRAGNPEIVVRGREREIRPVAVGRADAPDLDRRREQVLELEQRRNPVAIDQRQIHRVRAGLLREQDGVAVDLVAVSRARRTGSPR
jgi:hypothetical protein